MLPGNNSSLVKRCFERRLDCWKEVPNTNFMFHFKWMPTSSAFRFTQLSYCQKQMVNHFEFHQEVTTKDLLFKNLKAYAELNKINVFDYIPLTFLVDVDSQTYSPDIEKFSRCFEAIQGIVDAGNKNSPDYCKQCLKLIDQKLLQIGISKERRMVSHCRPKIVESHFAGRNIWILKATGFNRGRGVTVFNTMDKLKALIKFYSDTAPETSPAKADAPARKEKEDVVQSIIKSVKSRTFVIQKYIERPLLIRERKFDVRVWALVTQEMKVYFFKEGYVRTSSSCYSIEDEAIDKVNIHLTNNAVQKYCKEYGEFEDGNQLSFSAFQVNCYVTSRNT